MDTHFVLAGVNCVSICHGVNTCHNVPKTISQYVRSHVVVSVKGFWSDVGVVK